MSGPDVGASVASGDGPPDQSQENPGTQKGVPGPAAATSQGAEVAVIPPDAAPSVIAGSNNDGRPATSGRNGRSPHLSSRSFFDWVPDRVRNYVPTSVVLVVLTLLGVFALVVVNHQSYTKNQTQMADQFGADTVVVGVFAFIVAAAAAALAYPSYREWKRQVWGPSPELAIGYFNVNDYVPMSEGTSVTLNGIGSAHRFQIQVINNSRVPLKDGQLNIYLTFGETINVELAANDGFKLVHSASFVDGLRRGRAALEATASTGSSSALPHVSGGRRTVLLTLLQQFPACTRMFFQPELKFGSKCQFGLEVIVTGSNLRSDRQYRREWTAEVK